MIFSLSICINSQQYNMFTSLLLINNGLAPVDKWGHRQAVPDWVSAITTAAAFAHRMKCVFSK